MREAKEPATAVSWRIKNPSLEWLREQAAKDDRPVNWVINKVLEEARQAGRQNQDGAGA